MYDNVYRRETRKLGTVEEVVQMVEGMLNTPQKRHIVGGVLLSVSFLFGGLALTAMTTGEEEDRDEK